MKNSRKVTVCLMLLFTILISVIMPIFVIADSSDTWTVSFNLNGVDGFEPDPQTINDGGYVTPPESPTASGKRFISWHKESTCTDENIFEFESDTITEDTILYAKWEDCENIKMSASQYDIDFGEMKKGFTETNANSKVTTLNFSNEGTDFIGFVNFQIPYETLPVTVEYFDTTTPKAPGSTWNVNIKPNYNSPLANTPGTYEGAITFTATDGTVMYSGYTDENSYTITINCKIVIKSEETPVIPAISAVRISATDIVTDEAIEGATLKLIDSDENVVTQWVSTTEIHDISGLYTDKEYTIEAVVAPDGYTIPSDVTFIIANNGTITSTGSTALDSSSNTVLLVEFAKTYVEVKSVKNSDYSILSGVTIQILDKYGNVVEEWISGTTNHIIEGLLSNEEYTMKATTIPDEELYEFPDDVTFVIDENGVITSTGSISEKTLLFTIPKKSIIINSINIIYDKNKLPFYNNVSTDNFIKWVRNNTTTDNTALEVYSNANTELYTYNNSNLVYLSTSSDTLNLENEYAILYSIKSSDGYKFPNNVTSLNWSDQILITDIDGFTIKVNGETRNDVYIAYNSYWKCVMAYVPIGKPNKVIPVYRMFNPRNGEHLYTTDAHEVEVIFKTQGWGKEGIAWYTKETGKKVFRLFNPRLGNHLYTSDQHEIDVITKTQGWVLDFDGAPVMYAEGDVPVYRLFNPGLQGQHHLTTDLNEYRVIPQWGWKQEGIAMNVLSTGVPETTHYYKK